MPVPIQLVVFSISFNRFASLPEWLTDLQHIETISAHHNLILYLPHRLYQKFLVDFWSEREAYNLRMSVLLA